jgi:hypothetical protein
MHGIITETYSLDCKISDSVDHPKSLNNPLRIARIKDNSQEMSICRTALKFLEMRGRDAQMLRRQLFLLCHCILRSYIQLCGP